jgi:hypothetical protein
MYISGIGVSLSYIREDVIDSFEFKMCVDITTLPDNCSSTVIPNTTFKVTCNRSVKMMRKLLVRESGCSDLRNFIMILINPKL